jgi:SAM-dependent methyltransferase
MPDEALYDRIGVRYSAMRRTDPRWEEAIHEALGDVRSVLDVGAGTGSYEPRDRTVIALDPSLTMLRQRPPGAAPSVCGAAEALPFADGSFDASMGVLTVHHWSDWRRGLVEMRRVTRARIVIVSAEVFSEDVSFWLTSDYFPEIGALDRETVPMMSALLAELPGARDIPLLVPSDCTDGFCGAYWRRPHAYLDPAVQAGISGFSRIEPEAADRGLKRLERDLETGEWERKYGDLLSEEQIDIGYRLVVADL